MTNDRPKNLTGILQTALKELSCSDFNPLRSNNDLKKALESQLSLTNPYWVALDGKGYHTQTEDSFLLHIIPKNFAPEQKPSTGDFVAKIKIEKNSVVLEHYKMLDALNSETIGLISLPKKDLFKDCTAFIEHLGIILKESIDLTFSEQL